MRGKKGTQCVTTCFGWVSLISLRPQHTQTHIQSNELLFFDPKFENRKACKNNDWTSPVLIIMSLTLLQRISQCEHTTCVQSKIWNDWEQPWGQNNIKLEWRYFVDEASLRSGNKGAVYYSCALQVMKDVWLLHYTMLWTGIIRKRRGSRFI